MKTISVKELNKLICSTGILDGAIVRKGKNVYCVHKSERSESKWISFLPYEEYKTNMDKYNNTAEGWYGLLRIQ